MTALISSEQQFVHRMAQSKEKAEWGFELILERRRDDVARFFDSLAAEGMFKPENNSGPVPADNEGFVHIPFWPALRYLEVVAKQSGERNDRALGEKVMGIVRSVSAFREPDGSRRDNYHTFRIFAEILGMVPPEVVTRDDIELIPGWLTSRYDRGLVASKLDSGFLRRALSSDSQQEWDKACRVVYHCTATEWVAERGFGAREKHKPIGVVEDYWLAKLIGHHAEALGRKTGKQATDIFVGRLKEVYDQETTIPSHWSRPTVEDSDQNSPIEKPGDRFVEGLRDILLHWVDHDPGGAREYVRGMLGDDADIIRRIAIHTINHRWSELRELYFSAVSEKLFSNTHLHELYYLLRSHFGEFTDEQKAKTLETIHGIPPGEGEDKERLQRRAQRNWLSAIVNQGYGPADSWFKGLEADPTIGELSKHPSLHSYHEFWSGPGPSPFSVQEILQHAKRGTLIELLHSFTETDGFQGPETPTVRALVDILSEAVKQDAGVFIRILPDFLRASRSFQYGVINGFKSLWDDPAKSAEQQFDWDSTWARLLEFLIALLGDRTFWDEDVVTDRNLTPNRDWIPPLVAGFLKSGTQDDKHAYPEALLPHGWQLVNLLLENVEPEGEASDDPMHYAINSAKGKAIEALFNHALRACRVADKMSGKHDDAWESMRATFDRDLGKCKDGNFEMSTLSGSYVANLAYLSHDWLVANVEKIFPDGYPINFTCAVDGMAYAPEHRPVYKLLIDKGIIDKALRLDLKGRHSREKLIQRITLAYLWDDEELDGPRFSFLFESKAVGDLEEAGDFLWSVSSQKLHPTQIERVLDYWATCVDWSKTLAEPPAALLSSLSKLACYVKDIGDSEREWLMAVAPYVHVGHDADRFIEELERLADAYPKEASAVLARILDTYKPMFDFEDKLKSLIRKISAAGGDEKLAAISYADKLCSLRLKGMCELFKELQDT